MASAGDGMPVDSAQDKGHRARVAGEILAFASESPVPSVNEPEKVSGFPVDALQEGIYKELVSPSQVLCA